MPESFQPASWRTATYATAIQLIIVDRESGKHLENSGSRTLDIQNLTDALDLDSLRAPLANSQIPTDTMTCAISLQRPVVYEKPRCLEARIQDCVVVIVRKVLKSGVIQAETDSDPEK